MLRGLFAGWRSRRPSSVRAVSSDLRPFAAETALVLVFDAKYSEPIKVLLYSLHKHGVMQGCPLIIVTDDPAVAAEPFFCRRATEIELVPPETLALFSSVKGDLIPSKLRTHFAPKYTFLKLLLYRDRGYRRHVFMDGDTLCVGAMDESLLSQDYAVKAVRETPGGSFPIRDECRAKFVREDSVRMVEERSLPDPSSARRNVNSGFLTLQGAAINDELFDYALRLASEEAYAQEQAVTADMLRKRPELSYLELPIWYNMKRRVLDALGPEYTEENLPRVKLLHYIPTKPWKVKPDNRTSVDWLWWRYKEESDAWVRDQLTTMV